MAVHWVCMYRHSQSTRQQAATSSLAGYTKYRSTKAAVYRRIAGCFLRRGLRFPPPNFFMNGAVANLMKPSGRSLHSKKHSYRTSTLHLRQPCPQGE